MEAVATVATFAFQICSTFLAWLVSDWTTALFVAGNIILFVFSLVIMSSRGEDSNK